jgi:diguanylate cyclase (GGDEF)-like protein
LKLGERDEKLKDSLYDGKLKESKVYAAGPGRAAFLTVLNDAIRDKLGVAVIGLDLDNFKKANTEFGHLGADDLLRAIARAARSTTKRRSDVIIRFGGEEIFIVLKGLNEKELKNKMAELAKNYETIQRPFLIEDEENVDETKQVELRQKSGLMRFPKLRQLQTASMGGTYYDPNNPRYASMANGELADQLLAEADDAINASKELGKNQSNIYNEIDDKYKVNTKPQAV